MIINKRHKQIDMEISIDNYYFIKEHNKIKIKLRKDNINKIMNMKRIFNFFQNYNNTNKYYKNIYLGEYLKSKNFIHIKTAIDKENIITYKKKNKKHKNKINNKNNNKNTNE